MHYSLDYSEYCDGQHGQGPLEPEKLLMVAVLEEAISCYQRYAASQRRKWRRYFNEAETWFMEEDGDWLFSFSNVCYVLGLSPGFIRAGLVRWKERHLREKTPCKTHKLNSRRSDRKVYLRRYRRSKRISAQKTLRGVS
jgi:hypothetical protein